LQSRIRPHFLFNSMNIIASLIAVDPDTAERVVEDLSDLFRASLNEAGNQVPLKQELDLCQRYIRIEQLRLGNRLQVEWDTPTLPDDSYIPLLTLQPLVENAIYHGVQSRMEGGTVKISVTIEGEKIKVRISNPFHPDASDHNQKGNRMALENIRHRLQTLYGDNANLTNSISNDIYCAELTLPLHSKKAELL
ncbi:MAG TPA: histidine kinase, partial [Pseudomonadales bacterium]|nr:histidine kinase [Pseudomonadales bacterium]